MKKIIFIFVLFFWTSYNVYAIDAASKKKHPYTLLTKDYGILNGKDLDDDDCVKPEPYSQKHMTGEVYWQCFPRDGINVNLRDMGYSSHHLADNDGDLSITIYEKQGISHTYGLRRNWSIPDTEERFNRWLELMKGEKYVCLSGRHGLLSEEKTIDGKKYQEYYWTFEKLKTKKGCNSYFAPVDCS